MWLLINAANQWIRTHLTWSNSADAWRERIATLTVLAVAIALFWKGSQFSPGARIVLWIVLLGGAVVMFRRGWLQLFGPVLFYDMVRTGRRSRYILFRFLYVCGLLGILSWVYWMWWLDYRHSEGPMPIKRMAEFAESLFFTCMIVQLILTVLMTPAYVAGAIAEEKDRKTLEYLLATDLRNREIVLSKLISRLANLLLIVLAGLPVLSFVQFFGGVDPDLLLASFAATGLIMISMAGVSILCSVHARKPRDAIVLTYLVVAVYHVVSFLGFAILMSNIADVLLGFLIGGVVGVGPYLLPASGFSLELLSRATDWLLTADYKPLESAVNWFNSGNLFLAFAQLVEAIDKGKPLHDVLGEVLEKFAIFHGCVALLTSTLAVMQLRRVALKEAGGPSLVAGFSLIPRLWRRPQVGDQPMMWKEIFIEGGIRFGWLGRITLAMIVVLTFLPIPFIISHLVGSEMDPNARRHLADSMNRYVRSVGTIVACLTLLAVAVRAAGCISGERDKKTFDELLTTPLGASSILFGKWIGCIFNARLAWVWLGFIWLMGAMTDGLQIAAVPLLMFAWVVYAGVFSLVGMWFSMVCKTTLRATVWTLLCTIGMGAGHWIITSMCCFLPISMMAHTSGRDVEYIAKFELGQTPPFVLALLAFRAEEMSGRRMWDESLEFLGFSILGLGMWIIFGLVLAGIINHRFQEMTLRQDARVPESDRRANRTMPPRPPPAPPVYEAIPLKDIELSPGDRERIKELPEG
jgi:ABC-type transport system involved in multi-copper enzyme maturation permease subunit